MRPVRECEAKPEDDSDRVTGHTEIWNRNPSPSRAKLKLNPSDSKTSKSFPKSSLGRECQAGTPRIWKPMLALDSQPGVIRVAVLGGAILGKVQERKRAGSYSYVRACARARTLVHGINACLCCGQSGFWVGDRDSERKPEAMLQLKVWNLRLQEEPLQKKHVGTLVGNVARWNHVPEAATGGLESNPKPRNPKP